MATITLITIEEDHSGQRIDNFLVVTCKGVPKTRLYRAIRKGEVRVNQKRVRPDYRLQLGDQVRIPPIRRAEEKVHTLPSQSVIQKIEDSILVENTDYLIVNKPSGIPVHGGTGIKTGLIEAIRLLRPKAKFLELAHRLDRDTSGCILIAKKRSLLTKVHELLLHKKVKKHYLTLVKGSLLKEERVQVPLIKNQLISGERVVTVSSQGKASETLFRPLKHFQGATLVEAIPLTGRTHQIRVHAAHIGHPVAGDEKYGDREFDKEMKRFGLRRLFLHSASLSCRLDSEGNSLIGVCAPLSSDLKACIQRLKPR